MGGASERSLVCLGDSLDEMRELPAAVRRSFGYSLSALQMRESPFGDIKKLNGYHGVFEIRKSFGDTFRLIYWLAPSDVLYVLHVFKKKSHEGSRTPQRDSDLIRSRYKEAMHRVSQSLD